MASSCALGTVMYVSAFRPKVKNPQFMTASSFQEDHGVKIPGKIEVCISYMQKEMLVMDIC